LTVVQGWTIIDSTVKGLALNYPWRYKMIEETLAFAEYEAYMEFQDDFNEAWAELTDELFFI